MSTKPTFPQSPKKSVTAIKSTLSSVDILAALEELNKKYCVVKSIGKVVEYDSTRVEEPNPLSFYSFVNEMGANLSESIPDLAKRWKNWKKRREVKAIVYEPGRDLFFTDKGMDYLNTWRPSDLKPIKGDLTFWNKYLDHLFADDLTYRDWFLAWLAYPLQNPGAKLHTACIFWSRQTATGKSTLGYIMERIYGSHNFYEIEESALTAAFNDHDANACFIMGDEMRGGSSQKLNWDKMKSIITRDWITINLKFKAQYKIRNCINYYFTSNNMAAIAMDRNDRRYFVHRVSEKKAAQSVASNSEFNEWLRGEGHAAIYYSLLHDIDLSKPIVGGDPWSTKPAPFHPRADAPRSAAKLDMIVANRGEVEEFWDDFTSYPENHLDGPRDLFTMAELYFTFKRHCPSSKLSQNQFSREIHGYTSPLRGKNPVKLHTGQTKLLYDPFDKHRNDLSIDLIHQYEIEYTNLEIL